MMAGSYKYEAVARWTNNVDIFELDKILIPINVSNFHWIAVMVSMTEKSIQLYDPKVEPDYDAQLYFDQILQFLGDEHFNKKEVAMPDASSWRLVLQDPRLPTQPNGFDCGVYVSAFIYFSVQDLPFRCDPTNDGDIFAADLRFRFARSIMTKISHF
jgi:sentrin-specific protease 1